MSILIDTNVLARTAQPAHPHHTHAIKALQIIRSQGEIPCVVPQVLYEYWVIATRSESENGLGLATIDAETDLDQIVKLFRLYRDERSIFDCWRNLVARFHVQGKKAHDARLVAAMQHHKIKHILTFNGKDFGRFPDITVMTPQDLHK